MARLAGGTGTMLFVLLLSRVWGVTMSHERILDRERALRLTGVALASASTIDGIGTIVRKAVRDLIGQRPDCEALFAVRKDEGMTVVATSSGEQGPASELADLVPRWLLRLRQVEPAEPKLVPAADFAPDEQVATVSARFESVLLCPLVLTNRPSGEPLTGVLAILGKHRMLSGMSPALGILASQVALALERVPLSEEVTGRRGEALFRRLAQEALDVILVLDDDWIVKYASPSAARLYGDIPIEGTRADSLIADSERITPYWREDVYRGVYRITRHDGQRLLVEVRVTDLRHDETVQGRVLTIRDITEFRQFLGQLRHRALHDTLTGLPNRALFTDQAEHAITVARRNGTTAAVLFVDLDDFKVVNDTMGHAVGDELLAGVAQRLAGVARTPDIAARLGGDEFALLIETLPDPKAAEAFADRVIRAFSEPFELSAGPVLAGATVGVATTADSSDVGELLHHADLSLYAAKSQGKGRWHRYTSEPSAGMVYFFDESGTDRSAIPAEVALALQDDAVRDLALRAAGLPERSLKAIIDMVDSARSLHAGYSARPSRPAGHSK